MTEQKHTPGPWKVTRRGIMALNSETGRYGGVVCQPNWCGFDPDDVWLDIPREANARLIAAAPDYAAPAPRAIQMLRIAADVLRNQAPRAHYKYDGADCDGYCIADDCEAIADDLSAAIAKAEGKE